MLLAEGETTDRVYVEVHEREEWKEETMVSVRDSVCGMDIDPAAASGEYAGTTYYFCSENCHQQFVATPERLAA